MANSVDYKVFCQVEIEEKKRLSRVYQGVEDDKGPACQHLLAEHLEKLLASDLTPALRSYYSRQYNELRAELRALAVTGLTRKDFFDDASHTVLRESAQYESSLAFEETLGHVLTRTISDNLREKLATLEAEFISKKQEIEAQLKSAGGLAANSEVKPKDVVRVAMATVEGVNGRGVSQDDTYVRS